MLARERVMTYQWLNPGRELPSCDLAIVEINKTIVDLASSADSNNVCYSVWLGS